MRGGINVAISIGAKEEFIKIQCPFIIKKKTLNKLGKEGMSLNTIETLYDKPTTNIILNGESLIAFPLRSETKVPTLTTSTQIALEVLTLSLIHI